MLSPLRRVHARRYRRCGAVGETVEPRLSRLERSAFPLRAILSSRLVDKSCSLTSNPTVVRFLF